MSKHHYKHVTPVRSGPTGPKTPAPTAVGSDDNDHDGVLIAADDIRLSAYRKWENAGMPTGDGLQFWLQAEHELASNNSGSH